MFQIVHAAKWVFDCKIQRWYSRKLVICCQNWPVWAKASIYHRAAQTLCIRAAWQVKALWTLRSGARCRGSSEFVRSQAPQTWLSVPQESKWMKPYPVLHDFNLYVSTRVHGNQVSYTHDIMSSKKIWLTCKTCKIWRTILQKSMFFSICFAQPARPLSVMICSPSHETTRSASWIACSPSSNHRSIRSRSQPFSFHFWALYEKTSWCKRTMDDRCTMCLLSNYFCKHQKITWHQLYYIKCTDSS